MTPRSLVSALMLSTALFVAGCESAEEKAEGYYQSALSLMEDGDVDRALIELQNVFQFDGFHLEARQLYADTQFERGNFQEAYGQYLRLIEQHPEVTPIRQRLAEMAISRSDWDEVTRHGMAAFEQDPDSARSRAINAILSFRNARINNEDAAAAEAVEDIREVLTETPDNQIARQVLIEALIGGNTPSAALPELDILLAQDPMQFRFQMAKMQLLSNIGREDAAKAQLDEMFALFPDNREVHRILFLWYVRQGDDAATEAFLRELAGPPTENTAGHTDLIRYVLGSRGTEAALAELDALITANDGTENGLGYQATRAGISFGTGDQDGAITQMQDILDGAEPSDQIRDIKNQLARMLIQTGDQVGARALVEEVLAEDRANVGALLLRANWKIGEDDPDGAISDLRVALDQAPRNQDVLLLMARAHQRAGQSELASERLALAVEVSGNAAGPSMTYARFLASDNQIPIALAVLENALRVEPRNLELINDIAELRLGQQDWADIDQLRDVLLEINTAEALEMEASLRAAALIGQNRTDEGLAIIQDNLVDPNNPSAATVTVIMTLWNSDRREQARDMLNEALEDLSEDPALRMLDGTMRINEGDLVGAEEIYREVAAEFPGAEAPVRLLFRLLNIQDRGAEALDVLNAGLEANPEAFQLQQIKASFLEAEGDYDGAIAIYEAQYALDDSDVVVANNLASLIATYRDDPAELERAYSIARRLRGIGIPALQDTYGWLEYTQGNYDVALASLEPAAAGLPDEALVQFHLGMTYAALERREDAIATLTRAITLAEGRNLPQMETAASTIEALQAVE